MNQEFLRKIYDKMSPETQVKAKKIVKKYGKRKTESVDTKKKVPEFVPAKLKKAGKKAFKGIHAKCKIKVPKKKLSAYKRLLKGKGQKAGVKITK